MIHRIGICVLLIAISVPSLAQEPANRVSLSSPGYATIPVEPQKLRVAIPLFAHALTADEAIELLRQRKVEAKERCVMLQGMPDSVKFGGVTVETSDPTESNSYALTQRLNAMGNTIAIEDLPTIVTARVDMTCDWQLPQSDDEGLVALAEHVVSSLKKPDVTGKNKRPELAPREQELLDTIRSQNMVYSSRSTRYSVDEIRYVFVAEIDSETIAEGYTRAVEDGKQAIEAMAQASGMTSMQLTSISSNRQTVSQTTYNSGSRTRKDILTRSDSEIFSPTIDDLRYVIRVHMQYTVSE